MTLFDTVSVCVIAKFAGFDMPAFDLKFFINLLIVVIITSTVAVISTVLAVLISNRLIAVLVVLLLSFILLYGGRETVSRLNQPKQTTSFNVEGILMDNPLYLEGGSRVLYNMHVFISPYAQACYASNMLYETQTEKWGALKNVISGKLHKEVLREKVLTDNCKNTIVILKIKYFLIIKIHFKEGNENEKEVIYVRVVCCISFVNSRYSICSKHQKRRICDEI